MITFSSLAVLQDHQLLFFIAIITLAFSIILKSVKLLCLQAAILLCLLIAAESMPNALIATITILQALLGLFVIYKFKQAFDYNYHLVMEKTHQERPNYTAHSPGTVDSFL